VSDPLVELQRQATLGRMLAGVAHEISAPAGTILANCDTMLRVLDRIEQALAGGASDKARELVAACRELAQVDRMAGERIRGLVRSLKVAARAADPHPQMASVNEIVDSALQLAKAQFRDRVTVQTDFGTLPDVECYPHLLSQAILNLVTNAGQAIEAAGTITAGTGSKATQCISGSPTPARNSQRRSEKCLKQNSPPSRWNRDRPRSLDRAADCGGGSSRSGGFRKRMGTGTTFHIRIPLRQKEGA
jgi:signal transduction histidine kinase